MASINFIPYDTNINFVGLRRITFAVSIFIIVVSLFGFMSKGLNYGIDFLGGYIFEVRLPEKPDISTLR
jgi:preprotein translocase subunit SecF